MYIQCPSRYTPANQTAVFLAGGISGCHNWQNEMVGKLSKFPNLTIINPRRETFDINDQEQTEFQIQWEYEHLVMSDIVSFWFPKETMCPITLYELGWVSALNKKMVIGVDRNYQRREDVIIQTRLRRPEITVVDSIDDLVLEIGILT
jgi:hypothetical protein